MTPVFPTTIPSPVNTAAGRVLIVDDDELVQLFVQSALELANHFVQTADCVDRAVELLSNGVYDVVLVDLQLPDRSGLELIDILRMNFPATVPVLLTATNEVATAVDGMKRGAFDFLAKPADHKAILWSVERAIEASRYRMHGRELERIAAEWESLFDSCPDLIFVLDAKGHILRRNAAVESLARMGNSIEGRSAQEVYPGGLGRALIDCTRMCIAGNSVHPIRIRDDLIERCVSLNVNAIRMPDRSIPGVIIVGRDLTDLAKSEENRAQLVKQLFTVQEVERSRIARELHDGIGQSLVSMSLGLSSIANDVVSTDLKLRIERISRVASEALGDTRRLAHGLRPSILDEFGLPEALARLTDVFSHVNGIRAELVVPTLFNHRLPPDLESTVYRIVQEALANVLKHARAKTVDVVLDLSPDGLHVSVADDGEGIDPKESMMLNSGIGISDMRERTRILDGVFRLESNPNMGTTVDIRIPIPTFHDERMAS